MRAAAPPLPKNEQLLWGQSIPFFIMHLMPFAALWTGARWQDWAVCAALYVIRMFAITAGYHRYFAHRAYKMNRIATFLMAALGSTAAQKGVLWWAGHHRHHHKYSDQEEDIHSPKRGFWWSHQGWILCGKYNPTPWDRIKDFARYPELVWINKYWLLFPTALGVATFLVGGASMLFIGFFFSTVLLYHGTFTINSLAHVWGSRRFKTTDTSRNNGVLALLTLGEGWHNNHHHFAASANQGFYWWEIDISYYAIKLLEKLGIAWDVKRPPARVLERNLERPKAPIAAMVEPLPSPGDAE